MSEALPTAEKHRIGTVNKQQLAGGRTSALLSLSQVWTVVFSLSNARCNGKAGSEDDDGSASYEVLSPNGIVLAFHDQKHRR